MGYGPNLQAWAVYLMVVHFIPVQRCVQMLQSLTGATPSPGFVHGMLARVAALTSEVDKRIRTLITLAYAVCCDETPLRVGAKKPEPGRKKAEKYLLVAYTELWTHYQVGDRDLATFTAFVVKDLTASVVVHDWYQNYDSAQLGTLVHQLCCAHLLRDLDGAAEVYPDAVWPRQICDARTTSARDCSSLPGVRGDSRRRASECAQGRFRCWRGWCQSVMHMQTFDGRMARSGSR